MDSREICIWTDQRWYRALSAHLEKQGATIEQRLSEHFETMLKQLPAQEYERISQEIQKEDQRQREEQEASRKFAAFHVREQGREEYFRLEPPLDALGAARLMRSYIRKELRTAAQSFAGLLPNRTPVTAEEYDQMVAVHFESPTRVTGAFDLDFDKREFSTVDLEDGWRTFPMGDVSTAVYHAYRAEHGVSMEHRRSRFAQKLAGKELASAGHLCADQITFAEEISEIDGRLNFYLETDFDVDAMFELLPVKWTVK